MGGFAGLAAGRDRPERALKLPAAWEARRAIGERLLRIDKADPERWIEPARRARSDLAQAEAWEQGRTMTPEQAVTNALEGDRG